MSTTAEEIFIAAPKLEPFFPIEQIGCPACGCSGMGLLPRMWLELIGRSRSLFAVSYCAGGRPPIEDISNPIEQMMRGSSESRPKCGGVVEPHLHLTCSRCGFFRMMRTKA